MSRPPRSYANDAQQVERRERAAERDTRSVGRRTVQTSAPTAARPRAAPIRITAVKACDPPFSLDSSGRKIYKRECRLRHEGC